MILEQEMAIHNGNKFKKMIKKLLFIVTVVSTLSSCGFIEFKDAELDMERKNNISNRLKLNGYYYTAYSDPEIRNIYFLYSNGVFLYGAASLKSELPDLERMYKDGSFYEYAKMKKYNWGLYQITDSLLEIERWAPSSGGGLPSYFINGIVINDTTFVVQEIKRHQNDIVDTINTIYRFKCFGYKPDSTNSFID